MKIKLIIIVLLTVSSCSFREPIENVNLTYRDKDILVKVKITHRKKVNNSYVYYGIIEANLVGRDTKPSSNIPYIIAVYKDQKSRFNYDSIGDYPDFFRDLNWSKEVKRDKIYITFDRKVEVKKITLEAVNKKFAYLPLDFYDH